MKKLIATFLFASLCFLSAQYACAQQPLGVLKKYEDITVNGDVFECLKYDYLVFEPFGNAGEYCKIVFNYGGSTYGDTLKVHVGDVLEPPFLGPLKRYGDAQIFLGTLSSYSTDSAGTLPPKVACYAFK